MHTAYNGYYYKCVYKLREIRIGTIFKRIVKWGEGGGGGGGRARRRESPCTVYKYNIIYIILLAAAVVEVYAHSRHRVKAAGLHISRAHNANDIYDYAMLFFFSRLFLSLLLPRFSVSLSVRLSLSRPFRATIAVIFFVSFIRK